MDVIYVENHVRMRHSTVSLSEIKSSFSAGDRRSLKSELFGGGVGKVDKSGSHRTHENRIKIIMTSGFDVGILERVSIRHFVSCNNMARPPSRRRPFVAKMSQPSP